MVGGGDGVDEGEPVVGAPGEGEEALDGSEQVPDPDSPACLFEKLAAEGRALVLIRLRQGHVPVVNGGAGDAVFEVCVLLVEGDHVEFIRKPPKRI